MKTWRIETSLPSSKFSLQIERFAGSTHFIHRKFKRTLISQYTFQYSII